MENTNESEEKNAKEKILEYLSNKKTLIIAIVAVVLILAIIVAVYIFTKDRVKFKGESNGIKYSANMNSNSEVFVVMKNKTGKTVSKLKLTVSYYDSKGNELEAQTSVTDVYLKENEISLNNVTASRLYADQVSDYKVSIEPEYYEGEDKLSNYEKVEILEQKEKDDKIVANIKNETENSITHVCFYTVFYKKGLPVAFDANDVYSFSGEKEIKFDKPKDNDGNEVKYDFYKVYIKY